MSEFRGLRKHEKTQHSLVGPGSAALEAAVAIPRQGGPNFPKGIIKCIKYKIEIKYTSQTESSSVNHSHREEELSNGYHSFMVEVTW